MKPNNARKIPDSPAMSYRHTITLIILIFCMVSFAGIAPMKPSPLQLVLVPIGTVEPELLAWCKNQLPKNFNCQVRIADAVPIPDRSFHKTREQYDGDAVLEELRKANIPADRLVGLIDQDCYVQGLNFIFGVAS